MTLQYIQVLLGLFCSETINGSLASGETNTTAYVLKTIYKCGYRNIYQDQDYDALAGRYQDKFGYKTKQNNRQVQIELFAEAFRDNPRMIRDYETICEMESFQVVRNETTGKEKAQAIGGKHDDLVMAMCGALYCRNSQRAIPTQKVEIKKPVAFDPLNFGETDHIQVKGDFQWD